MTVPSTAPALTRHQIAAMPYVRVWLWIIALLVFAMVIVGGATRLTESGLSITEWQPLLGTIPPSSEADWLAAFEKYKQIPQYSVVNAAMTLAEFKFIYWWEWAHRLLGRLIGVAFFVPLVIFAATQRLERRLLPRLLVIFLLGALQGALGWYMVASGLVDRVSVSQYRLSAHLTLAALIFGAVVWTTLGIGKQRRAPAQGRDYAVLMIAGLVLLQVAVGGFVAGLDAGMGYNTWPLMDGSLIPPGLFVMEPAWRNLFENAMTVQFNHRMLAYVIALCVALYAWRTQTSAAFVLLAAVLLQAALGIWTLLSQVPLTFALMHQGGATILFAAALWTLHRELSPAPVPDRR